MVLLFHVFYLLGKCIYNRFCIKKLIILPDVACDEHLFEDDDDDAFDVNVSKLENTSWWMHDKINNFFPPAYIQRYSAVANVLRNYNGKLYKIVDFGCAELNFLRYLKNIPEVQHILCVDINKEILKIYEKKAAPLITELLLSRERMLTIEICKGSVTDNDTKLKNANAVICIELIEHLYPDTLIDLPFNIFGYIKPEVAIITTPNVEFNTIFPNLSGHRHPDHKFEWTRKQFQDWAQDIVIKYPYYRVTFHGICNGPEGTEELGTLTQMAVFHRILPREDSKIEALTLDEYFRLEGQDGLFDTVGKYNYFIKSDTRSDEQKILDDAIYYIHYLSYNDINNEESSRNYEIYLDRILEFMPKYNITAELLKSILIDAGWNVVNQENRLVVLNPSPSSSENDESNDNYMESLNDEYENLSNENFNEMWDYVHDSFANENAEYLSEQNRHSDVWHEESNEEWNNLNSIINEIPINESEEYLSVEQNSHIENWHDSTNFTNEESRWDCKSDLLIDETFTGISENYSSAQNPHVENWPEESSIIVPENYSINQDNTYLFDGENIVTEESESLKELCAYNDVVQPAVSENDQLDLENAQEIISVSNFQPYMFVSSTSASLNFNHEMNNSLQDFSAHYQNNSLIHNQDLLNSTFCQSEITTEAAINADESVVEDKSCFKKNLLKEDTQGSEINFLLPTHSNYNCNVEEDKDISIKNQICQDLDVSLEACSNDFNNRLKYTSSPRTKTSVINTVSKSPKHRELIPATNNDVLLNTMEKIEEIVSDTVSDLLESNQESNNSITETIQLYTTCNSANTSKFDTHIFIDNSIQDKSYIENKKLNNIDKSTSRELIQNISHEHRENNTINHESNITNDKQNIDAHHILTLNNEELKHEDKNIYCTLEKTHRTDTKIHLENVNDFDQLNARRNSLNSSKELLDSKSQSVNNYSLSECAKEVSVLRNDSFISCKSEETLNIHSASISKNKDHVGTSKDASNIAVSVNDVEAKSSSPVETPPNSWSPEIMDSGYPNSTSAQDITPEYDLSSIAQDHVSDSESPSVAEAPRIGVLEPIEVENGDLANNNRDDEGNNMVAVDADDIENLQPLIDVLENDIENENDIYVMQNGFPIWLLRILDMANPLDFDIQVRQNLQVPDEAADDANYVGRDEGFSSSSDTESDIVYNEMENDGK